VRRRDPIGILLGIGIIIAIGNFLLQEPIVQTSNFRFIGPDGKPLNLKCKYTAPNYSNRYCLNIYDCSNGKSYHCVTNVERY